MDCKSEAASHYAGCDCNEEHWQDQISRLTRERDEARERERLARLVAEQQQERAAGLSRELLAAMHRLRDLVAAETRFAELEEALREIADECECDFPRCQSNLARRALEVQP